jgi:HK97 family phage prohead protease
MTDFLAAPLEIKSIGTEASGEFSGYGAVYHSLDLVGDRLMPQCFAETLAERKALGRPLPMHLNHGLRELDGERAVGTWRVVEEDDKGLRVEGKIAAMNTEKGRYLFERVREGAISGLSVGFKVRRGDATYPNTPGQPSRIIKKAWLGEISLVDDPCHPHARVMDVKSLTAGLDLIGERIARGDTITEREVEAQLRERLGLSRSQAARFAAGGVKSLIARESDEGEADSPEVKAALSEMLDALSTFTLPPLK